MECCLGSRKSWGKKAQIENLLKGTILTFLHLVSPMLLLALPKNKHLKIVMVDGEDTQ